MLTLFVLVYGLSCGAPIALMPTILADSVGLRRYGSLSGLLVTLGVIGSAAGPIVAGVVFDRIGSYMGIFEFFTIALLVAGFLPIGCVSFRHREAAMAAVTAGCFLKPESTEVGSMAELQHKFVTTNGIRMHYAEQGTGPLVVLCHGFPESWYSWRHQISALAAAGFRVVAPDQRGYGQTDRPEPVEAYDILNLVGDIVGLVNSLGVDSATIVGHDWGAPVAWQLPRFCAPIFSARSRC